MLNKQHSRTIFKRFTGIRTSLRLSHSINGTPARQWIGSSPRLVTVSGYILRKSLSALNSINLAGGIVTDYWNIRILDSEMVFRLKLFGLSLLISVLMPCLILTLSARRRLIARNTSLKLIEQAIGKWSDAKNFGLPAAETENHGIRDWGTCAMSSGFYRPDDKKYLDNDDC